MQFLQWMFTDNYDSSFCFWVFEKRLTQNNCFLFCKKYGLFNSSIFFNNQQIFTVLPSKLSWSAFRVDKILVFHTRSRVVSGHSHGGGFVQRTYTQTVLLEMSCEISDQWFLKPRLLYTGFYCI